MRPTQPTALTQLRSSVRSGHYPRLPSTKTKTTVGVRRQPWAIQLQTVKPLLTLVRRSNFPGGSASLLGFHFAIARSIHSTEQGSCWLTTEE